MHEMTGLFFGTFNPIHIGHVLVAEYLADYAGLKRVWFILSPMSPFKQNTPQVLAKHRFLMIKKAIKGNPRFFVHDIELHMPTPSYTVDTLKALHKRYPSREFILMMGSDTLAGMPHWKEGTHLMQKYQILVYPRSSADISQWKSWKNIQVVEGPRVDVSSTQIRALIKAGRSVRYLVPEFTRRYIVENHLYK
ncbi:MAG: nicotinate (nicotinamide) nucleotide adenylyltransferase [Chitinophagales bacterium]|nr:nicotinate (nicotinamide) nucleotide adenylyltransferase [Chitinophagales bacterium]MDW8427181.1 nicotinate (nicotinamide) nucleotide adenylyltransferase [Chitinophagales bacterium]